MIRIGQLLKER